MSFDWRYRHTVLTCLTAAFFATMFARVAISPVVPNVEEQFDVSTGMVGLALTGMWAAYGLSQFPSGVLGDRIGDRRVMLIATSLTALCVLLVALAPTFWLFATFVVLLGAGAGLHYTVATTYLTRLFENTGRAIGIHVAGGPLAGVLAPVVVAAVAVRYGWRPALLIAVAIALPATVLLWWFVRPTAPRQPDRPMRERFEAGSLSRLLSRPEIAYTTLLAVLATFVWQATTSFLPTLLAVHHGFSIPAAGLLFSVYFAVQGVLVPGIGWASDRFGRDRVLVLVLGAGVPGYAALAVGNSTTMVLAGVGLAAVAMSWSAPLQARFIHHLSESERNAGFGLVRTVYVLLGALGSVVTGVLADVAGWAVAAGALATLLAIAAVSIAIVRVVRSDW